MEQVVAVYLLGGAGQTDEGCFTPCSFVFAGGAVIRQGWQPLAVPTCAFSIRSWVSMSSPCERVWAP